MRSAAVSILTTADVAAVLGISARRVQQLAASRNVGELVGRDILFHPADLEQLRERVPGRPKRQGSDPMSVPEPITIQSLQSEPIPGLRSSNAWTAFTALMEHLGIPKGPVWTDEQPFPVSNYADPDNDSDNPIVVRLREAAGNPRATVWVVNLGDFRWVYAAASSDGRMHYTERGL